MNFEVVDNVFQTVTLLLSAAAAFVLSVMKRSRVLMMLSFGYGSFMMGTLFYVLHIVILGYNPKISMFPRCRGLRHISFSSR